MKIKNKKSLQDAFLRLFVNREDVYAMQQSKGYLKIQKSLSTAVIEKHFAGEVTVGLYQLDRNSIVKWLCFDLDPENLKDPKKTAQTIIRECILKPDPKTPRFYRNTMLLEASRYPDPSYHLWVFFEFPVPAKIAGWLGLKILEHANINPKQVEVFPKQTELTKDRPYGNLVKAPLGLHRVDNKWSCFLDLTTFQPLSNNCLLNVQGISFLDSELAVICGFEDKKHVQIKFEMPRNYKSLKSKEEQRIAQFLSRYWKPGSRNRVEMAFLGYCLKKGVAHKTAYKIIDQVAQLTKDDERVERLQLVNYHYKNRLAIASQLLGASGLKTIVKEALA